MQTDKKKYPLGSLVICISLLSNLFIWLPQSNAVTQKITYNIQGDCADYYDENGEYAFFEEEEIWDCYISVKLSPVKPVRTIQLQYWNGRKWLLESKSVTNAKGVGYLDFDPECSDGQYCDGTWKFRVYVGAIAGQKSNISTTFEVTFYPGYASDY